MNHFLNWMILHVPVINGVLTSIKWPKNKSVTGGEITRLTGLLSPSTLYLDIPDDFWKSKSTIEKIRLIVQKSGVHQSRLVVKISLFTLLCHWLYHFRSSTSLQKNAATCFLTSSNIASSLYQRITPPEILRLQGDKVGPKTIPYKSGSELWDT